MPGQGTSRGKGENFNLQEVPAGQARDIRFESSFGMPTRQNDTQNFPAATARLEPGPTRGSQELSSGDCGWEPIVNSNMHAQSPDRRIAVSITECVTFAQGCRIMEEPDVQCQTHDGIPQIYDFKAGKAGDAGPDGVRLRLFPSSRKHNLP